MSIWYRMTTALLVTASLLAGTVRYGAAQDATPGVDSEATPDGSSQSSAGGPRLDLAAMALDGNDLPGNYVRYLENYIPGDQVAEQITGGAVSPREIARTGLQWFYESRYDTSDQSSTIHSYIEEYDSPAGAKEGFALVEDETRYSGAGDFKDEPLKGVGEKPSELTVGTTPAQGQNPETKSVDATFRVGRLLAGLTMESSTTSPDQQQVEDLAAKLEKRMRTVLDGKSPAKIDAALPTSLVALPDTWAAVQEGYLLGDELVRGSAGSSGPARGFKSAYERVSSATPDEGPYIYDGLVQFSRSEDALAVLQNADQLNLPFGTGVERTESLRVAGTDAAVGLRSAFASNGAPDSFWIVFVVDDRLAAVGVLAASTAEEAAIEVAAQQAACLTSDGPCATLSLDDSLLAPTNATPEATPSS